MPKSVLLVDDSQAVREVMRHFFERQADWKVGGEAGDGAAPEYVFQNRHLGPSSMGRGRGLE